jgi:hypothetical protein
MLEGLKEKATQPIGPLPAFAWVVVAVGGYLGYKILKGRSNGTTAASTTSTTVGASGETVAPSSSDMNALTSQISTLGNQINTLTGKVSGTIGTVSTPIVNPNPTPAPTGPIFPTGALTAPVYAGDTLAKWGARHGLTAREVLRLNQGNYGLSDAANSSLTQSIKAGWHLIFQAGAAAATTTATVASTAVASAGVPAAAPTYSSNTAVTTSVGNPINVTKAATDVVHTAVATPILLGLPTMSTATVNAAAIQIPSITSTPSHIVPKTITLTAPAKKVATPVVQAAKKVLPNAATGPTIALSSTSTRRVN